MSRQFLLLHHDQNVVGDRTYISIRQSAFSWYSKYFGQWAAKWYSLHQTVLPWTVCHPHLAQVHTERRKTKKEERMVAIMTCISAWMSAVDGFHNFFWLFFREDSSYFYEITYELWPNSFKAFSVQSACYSPSLLSSPFLSRYNKYYTYTAGIAKSIDDKS
jgi:hypothetical protein